MAALTGERDTPHLHLDYVINYPQATNTKIYSGALAMADGTTGYAKPAADTANGRVLGRAQATGDTTATGPNGVVADGVGNLDVIHGVFVLDNPAGANSLTIADTGKLCYILDDHSVIRAAGTTNSIIAGKVVSVDTVNAKATVDTRQKV